MTMGRVIKITKTGDIDTTFDAGTGISTGNANFIRYTKKMIESSLVVHLVNLMVRTLRMLL